MDLRFAKKELEALYTTEKGAKRYPPEVVDAFFRRMAFVRGAKDERDLRASRGARLEKMTGKPGRYSLRLTKRWRVEFAFEPPQGSDKTVVVLEISKHYGD